MPTRVDETHEAALPPGCPHCGGAVHETRVADQYQEDLPPVQRVGVIDGADAEREPADEGCEGEATRGGQKERHDELRGFPHGGDSGVGAGGQSFAP